MDIFNINIFIGFNEDAPTEAPERDTPATPKRLDPIAELKEAVGSIVLEFNKRYQNSNIPYLDFSRGDRRWLDALLRDLQRAYVASPQDAMIMSGKATPRNRFNHSQTWQQFIDGLVEDKAVAGHDFSQNQLKHLAALIDLLSKGRKLAGCGSLVFREADTGKVLA